MIRKTHFILTGCHDKIILGDHTFDDAHTNPEIILFVHGLKGFKDWGAHHLMADFFTQHGYRFLKFNFSHSGVTADSPLDVTDLDTFASNTVSIELSDLNTVINYITHVYPNQNLTLIGHSRGGGISILKAASDPRISRLVTLSAIADFSSLWKPEQEAEWKRTGRIYVENARTKEQMPLNSTLLEDLEEHKDEYNLLAAAARVEIPWLIVHGDDDVNVPFAVGEKLAAQQPAASLVKIRGANHVFGASHPYKGDKLPAALAGVCNEVLQFLQSQPAATERQSSSRLP